MEHYTNIWGESSSEYFALNEFMRLSITPLYNVASFITILSLHVARLDTIAFELQHSWVEFLNIESLTNAPTHYIENIHIGSMGHICPWSLSFSLVNFTLKTISVHRAWKHIAYQSKLQILLENTKDNQEYNFLLY